MNTQADDSTSDSTMKDKTDARISKPELPTITRIGGSHLREFQGNEIQSALMLTANNQVALAQYLNNYTDDGFDAALAEMGSGKMQVERADKAGLLLDETIANMNAANPSLGGREKALNTAYMVDNDCGFKCTFIRTFTATEDASWTDEP